MTERPISIFGLGRSQEDINLLRQYGTPEVLDILNPAVTELQEKGDRGGIASIHAVKLLREGVAGLFIMNLTNQTFLASAALVFPSREVNRAIPIIVLNVSHPFFQTPRTWTPEGKQELVRAIIRLPELYESILNDRRWSLLRMDQAQSALRSGRVPKIIFDAIS